MWEKKRLSGDDGVEGRCLLEIFPAFYSFRPPVCTLLKNRVKNEWHTGNKTVSKRHKIFFPNATTCSYELSWSPRPGCGGSVTDLRGWDAHEAQLRCPDGMRGDILGNEVPGGALSLDLLTTQTMVTTGILPYKENSHGRAGNRTRNLVISSQKLWPLDHEAEAYHYIKFITVRVGGGGKRCNS